MAEYSTNPAKFTLVLPPPTAEELATIMELKAEHMQLQEERKLYRGLFEAVYNDLAKAWTEDARLRTEIQHLREELMSIGSSLGFDTSTCEAWQHASSEEGAENIQEFYLHMRTKASNSAAVDEQDLPPQLPSDSQPHRGAEVLDLQASVATEAALRASGMQIVGLTTTTENTRISWDACTAPGGYTWPTEPTPMLDQCQSFMQTATQTFQAPIQRSMSTGTSTLPILPESSQGLMLCSPLSPVGGFSNSASRTNAIVEAYPLQVSTACMPMLQDDSLYNVTAEEMHSLTAAGCKVSQDHVQTCQRPQTGSTLQVADIPVTRPPENFTMGCNLAYEEQVCLLEHTQPQGSHAQSPLDSSTGPDSSPIAPGLTTLIIRNVPARYTKEMLIREWPADGAYDFLYLPFNFKQKRTAGFAFLNFTSHEAAVAFHRQWHGKPLRDHGTAKNLNISAADVQGLEENVRHLFASNISRVKNIKFLPSVFNGIQEVPFAEVLDRMDLSCVPDLAEQHV